MSFRTNYRFVDCSMGGHEIFLPETIEKVKHTKNGDITEVVVQDISQCKKLPDLRTTDIDLLLKANVPLERVNTKMYDAFDIEQNFKLEIKQRAIDEHNKAYEEQKKLEELNNQSNKQNQPENKEVNNEK